MTKDKATMQDIADSLGLSRTTVSKVLNGSPNMPSKTIAQVLKKAKEMNYKQFSYLQAVQELECNSSTYRGGSFALLVNIIPEHFHIASAIMASLEQEISKYGYSLTIHMITPQDIHAMTLPLNFKLDQVDAILGIELFDKDFSGMLCSLGKPVLFFDSFYNPYTTLPSANIVLMENRHSVFQMLDSVLEANPISQTGFIGDYNHCISFHERYEGYRAALLAHGLPYTQEYCITEDDSFFQDSDWLLTQLMQMQELPKLFCCANDLLAWKVIGALKQMHLSVPKDILICGFDDTLILNSIDSTLTTVATPSKEMGIMAARILLDRIENPSLPITTIYLNTQVQIRQSTKPQCHTQHPAS